MKKKILIGFIIFIILVLGGGIFYIKYFNNTKETYNQEEFTEQIQTDEVKQEENTTEEIEQVDNVFQVETNITDEQTKPNTSNVTSNKPSKNTPISENNKIVDTPKNTNTSASTEQPKEETRQETPVQQPIQQPVEQPKEIGEKFVYNTTLERAVIDVINNNPSQSMLDNTYNVISDSSITGIAGFFTVDKNGASKDNTIKNRTINMLTFKSGTIKVYARDYFKDGNYVWTECFVL